MNPPYNVPWSLFDLAEVRLYLNGDEDEFIRLVREGVPYCRAASFARTFRESLQLMVDGGVRIPAVETVIAELREVEASFGS